MIAAFSPLTLYDDDAAVLRRLLDETTLIDRAKALIREKLASARLVDAANLPGNVATINSRVTFQVGNDVPTTAYLVDTGQPIRLVQELIPLRSLVGLAILGLREGDLAVLEAHQNPGATLTLKRVLHQPQRELKAIFGAAPLATSKGGARRAGGSGNFQQTQNFSSQKGAVR